MMDIVTFVKSLPANSVLKLFFSTPSKPGFITPHRSDINVISEHYDEEYFWGWSVYTGDEWDANKYPNLEYIDYIDLRNRVQNGIPWNIVATPAIGDAFTVNELLNLLSYWSITVCDRADIKFEFIEKYDYLAELGEYYRNNSKGEEDYKTNDESYEFAPGIRMTSKAFDKLLAMDDEVRIVVSKNIIETFNRLLGNKDIDG